MNTHSWQAVLFDLDGTLLNTLRDLGDSMNQVLEQEGFPTHPLDAYRYFVGDGVDKLVARSLPDHAREPDRISRLTDMMRLEYKKRWMDHTAPYPGIAELLRELADRDLRLAILSNKPHRATQYLVDRLLPGDRFELVLGAREGIPKKPDPAGAHEVAERFNAPPENFLYLGDTNTDMLTAVAAGMHPVGVLWGFRNAGELRESGARTLLDHPGELLSLIDTEQPAQPN